MFHHIADDLGGDDAHSLDLLLGPLWPIAVHRDDEEISLGAQRVFE
jgi:hypothetical protein